MISVYSITPLVFELPNVLSGPDRNADGVGMFGGSVVRVFSWWLIFAVVAVGVAGLGYFANKYAKKNRRHAHRLTPSSSC